ncbi:MAG: hypothetical protein IPN69_12590 [Acidobacteria bacterium]|nr:hypothetical protein [Acidobacteriota bacterium]MBK8811554.1 hypothetical protein [Acidobacteriota bacterium]
MPFLEGLAGCLDIARFPFCARENARSAMAIRFLAQSPPRSQRQEFSKSASFRKRIFKRLNQMDLLSPCFFGAPFGRNPIGRLFRNPGLIYPRFFGTPCARRSDSHFLTSEPGHREIFFG